MRGRRAFLGGLLASGLCPAPGWADLGDPAYLAAARDASGAHHLCGLTLAGGIAFALPLPARGHAAAAHPTRPLAVGFARRPGRFAIVLDCALGREVARLEAPEGRHFYGHGTFSQDGTRLYTTENDYDAARGRIGVWDVTAGFVRMDELASGGIGPHDLKRLPGSDRLVVANGGIETHPETGRTKLNLPRMRPNLTVMGPDGHILGQSELPRDLHRNSIRHLAVATDGTIAFAMQWQGDVTETPPLVGLQSPTGAITLFEAPAQDTALMQGYAGSVALSPDARQVAITSPRGGRCQIFDTRTGQLAATSILADVCGVAPARAGFTLTTGTGTVLSPTSQTQHPLQWDNHLIAL
ncbi:MAG: DUF1513 domain-containing protein [Marinibacterium sp.]|nr:DUF1513 domain-containing protein [Marinibacterium sp.]